MCTLVHCRYTLSLKNHKSYHQLSLIYHALRSKYNNIYIINIYIYSLNYFKENRSCDNKGGSETKIISSVRFSRDWKIR